MATAHGGPRPAPVLTWNEPMPVEVRPVLEAYVAEFAAYLPRWVIQLNLHYDPRLGDRAFAECSVAKDYREVHVTVGPSWLALPDDERRAVVAHEFAHPFTTHVRTLVFDLLKALGAAVPDALRAFAEAQITAALEEATCDVADALDRAAASLPARHPATLRPADVR